MRIVISRRSGSDIEEDIDDNDDDNEGEISTRLTSTQGDWATEELDTKEVEEKEKLIENEAEKIIDKVIDDVFEENRVTIATQTQLTDDENDDGGIQEYFESVSQTGNESKTESVHFQLPESSPRDDLSREDVIVLPREKSPKSVKLFFLQDKGAVLEAGSSSLGSQRLHNTSRTRLVMSPPYKPTPSLSNNNIYSEMTYKVGKTSTYYSSMRNSALSRTMPELYDKRMHQSGYSGRPPSPIIRSIEKAHQKTELLNDILDDKPRKKTLKMPIENKENRQAKQRTLSASSKSQSTTSSRATSAKLRPKTTASRVTNVSSLSNRLLNFVSIDDVPTRYISDKRRTTRFSATTLRSDRNTHSRPHSGKTESGIFDIQSQSSDNGHNNEGIIDNADGQNDELYDLIFSKELENPNRAVNTGFDVIMDNRVSKVIHPNVRRGLFKYDKSCGKPVKFAEGSDFFQRMQATLRLQILIGEGSPTREKITNKINAFHARSEKNSSRSVSESGTYRSTTTQ